MKKFISILIPTAFMFLIIDVFIALLFLIDKLIEGKTETYTSFVEPLLFTNLYGIIATIVFVYINRPFLDKRILYSITIMAIGMLITTFIIDKSEIIYQCLYFIIGVLAGGKCVKSFQNYKITVFFKDNRSNA